MRGGRLGFLAPGLLLAVGLASGCKGSYGPVETCQTLAKQQCRFLYECCNAIDRDLAGSLNQWAPQAGPHGTREQCEAQYEEIYCAALAPLSDAKREGRAEWNTAEARRCWGFIEEAARSCDAATYLFGFMDQTDCELTTLITGEVARGEACYLDAECADADSACVPEETSTETEVVTARGICEGPPQVGEPCPGGLCASGAFCESGAASPTCQAVKADGQPCGGAEECQSGICGAGGSCAPKKVDGEACLVDAECVSELCDGELQPAACAPKRANGEACLYGAQCVSTFCDPVDAVCADASAAGDVVYALCEG